MDPLNTIKVISSFIMLIAAIVCGIVELKKNPEYWLNRFFALTYIFIGVGSAFYTAYHIILDNPTIIIPLNIAANIFYNLGLSCLIMVTFILDHSEKEAVSSRYLVIAFGVNCVILLGFIFWTPTLNLDYYELGIVDTETPLFFFLALSILRLVVVLYVMIKFNVISKKSEGIIKKRVRLVSIGTLILVIGFMMNIFSANLGALGIYLEILGIWLSIIGLLISARGFLL